MPTRKKQLMLLLPAILLSTALAQGSESFSRFGDTIQQQENGIFAHFSGGPLVPYGGKYGDSMIEDDTQNGRMIPLHGFFPFYGGRYNYTVISTNGYIGFGYFSEQSSTFKIGKEVDWPNNADPAIMAPYLCRQRIGSANNVHSRVYYRIEKRPSSFRDVSAILPQRATCQSQHSVFCDSTSADFLNKVELAIQDGVAGGGVFRAAAALIVTWKDMMPNIGDEQDLKASYQIVWATDAQGHLAYTITNYEKLNFDAADMNGNSRTGRCQALFNGGNHTGTVPLDLSDFTKTAPSSLVDRSSVPHITKGRYLHRVDDIVRHAGCSNKTGGTHPLLVYPNIVSMLGQVTVEVNALCLDVGTSYILMIENRQSAPCEVLSPAIARCRLPKILDWGTKTIYFQPQGGLAQDEKAFVGFIYFVPPTIDPTRLDVGNVAQWYKNPVSSPRILKWYPRNFTTNLVTGFDTFNARSFTDNSIYAVSLGLYVVGYKEARDNTKRKFIPQHRVLARLATYSNQADDEYRWKPQIEHIDITHVEAWYLTEYERKEELYTYRFGYLKLAPIVTSGETIKQDHSVNIDLPEGLVTSPLSLHWLWTTYESEELTKLVQEHGTKGQAEFVKKQAREMCKEWYEEDGALNNFIRETESNASCPCKEEQAAMDYGRFMPHPRCSKLFRDVTCTETLGSSNCYMSAQNVRGSQITVTNDDVQENSYMTHYGQTCCYDRDGYLMQSSYQPVIKIDDSTPYSPGFPTRAYEHGTYPDIGMFEVPGLSTFHHDILPYYLCCKYTDFRCQLFYWRRPSSACQAYEAPATGSVLGAGVYSTLDGRQFVFNEPGVFNLLHAHGEHGSPEVQIQVRQEIYPDRSVNFGKIVYNQDRVVPSNTTVITGVALHSDGADTVHVILRKDTYRMRYRTTILVGNVVRYFDNMVLQKFKGVTIYANNVHKGQSEVYVVMDNAQIGVRIRESFSIDMDVTSQFWESPGMLDVTVSVPPQYNVQTSPHATQRKQAKVSGLLMPYPEQNSGTFQNTLQWSDVNNDATRGTLMQYKINGIDQYSQQNHVKDLFITTSEAEQIFNAFPDHYLKGPTYTVASKYNVYSFVPMNEQHYRNFIDFCKTAVKMETYQPDWEKLALKRCPVIDTMEHQCSSEVACLFGVTTLQSQLVGDEVKAKFDHYHTQRYEMLRHYNSCGAMNIEYPEFLIKGPSSASRAYIEGDTLQFSCYQTHHEYGDLIFRCQKEELSHYDDGVDLEHRYAMRWTSGDQPWCRDRVKDNFLTWLKWIAIAVGVLLIIVLIFATCWAMKQKQRNAADAQPEGVEMVPLRSEMLPPKGPIRYVRRTETPQSDILPKLDKEPSRKGSQSSLHQTLNDSSFDYNEYRPKRRRPTSSKSAFASRGEIAV